MTPPAQPPRGITHTGFLLPDVRAEADRFAQMLGVTFRPPAPLVFPIVETASGTERDVEVLITYCGDGPPFYELLEATGDTLWSARHGFGPHHVGGYFADIAAQERRLEALGLEVEGRIHLDSGEHVITFLDPASAGGTRVELLSDTLHPNWRAWMAGGPPPGHERYPD
jgi:hypothetical protein